MVPGIAPALLLLLLCLVGGPGGAAASDGADSPPDWAEELFRLSGLDAPVESIAAQMWAGMTPQLAQVPEPLHEIIERNLRSAYAAEPLKERVLARFRAGPAPHADETLRWLRTPLGRRLTAAEEAVATVEAMERKRAFWASGVEIPPEREALLRAIDVASGSTDYVTDLTLATVLVVALGIDVTGQTPQGIEALKREAEEGRPRLREAMERYVRQVHHYTYREITDADLTAYVAFLESDAGAWYCDMTTHVFLLELSDSASRFANSVREDLEALRDTQAL